MQRFRGLALGLIGLAGVAQAQTLVPDDPLLENPASASGSAGWATVPKGQLCVFIEQIWRQDRASG